MPGRHEDLAHQTLGRLLHSDEQAFAAALSAIFARGVHDFAEVARELTAAGVRAPTSGTSAWTTDLLARELEVINRSLDKAYATDGFGA